MIVRDAVHGSIEATELEERVIDTPEFQRLRYVRQLATAYLVYPSAAHSRFEHGLGAMHLTGLVARRLDLEDEEVALLRLAGLLHDVGHSAFSHLGEDVLLPRGRPPHEERGRKLIQNSAIGDLIHAAGFSLNDLITRMEGEGTGALVTENLGTDRLDYLLRDAHHTGVSYSLVDKDRLLETLVLQQGRVRVHEKGVIVAESLLVSRYFMFSAVYHHPAVRIASAMLQKALGQALDRGVLTLEGLEQGTDLEALAKLRDNGVELGRRVLERRLFKKALVLREHNAPPGARKLFQAKDIEHNLSEHLIASGLDDQSFVVCPPPEGKGVSGVEVVMKDGRVEPLEKLSPLLRALGQESAQRSLIVAADEKLVQKTAQAARKYFEDV